MPKLPINQEELSGAAGALRKFFTDSIENTKANLPAASAAPPPAVPSSQLNTLSMPEYVKEAMANSPPEVPGAGELESPSRRALLQRAALSAGANALGVSPLGLATKALLKGGAKLVPKAPPMPPEEVGNRLSSWFQGAIKKVGADTVGVVDDTSDVSPFVDKWLKADGAYDEEATELYPSLADAMGIKSLSHLATQAGIPEEDLLKHLNKPLENVDYNPATNPAKLIDDLGHDHMNAMLSHELMLQDGRPKEIWRSTHLSDDDISDAAVQHINPEDYDGANAPEMAAEDYVNHYLHEAGKREFPLHAQVFGDDGLSNYASGPTRWNDLIDTLGDSRYIDDLHGQGMNHAENLGIVDGEDQEPYGEFKK